MIIERQPSDLIFGSGEYRRVRQRITECFDEQELWILCFDLGIEYDNLEAIGKAGKVRELVALCHRLNRISLLIQLCKERRPDFDDWDSLFSDREGLNPPFKGLVHYKDLFRNSQKPVRFPDGKTSTILIANDILL